MRFLSSSIATTIVSCVPVDISKGLIILTVCGVLATLADGQSRPNVWKEPDAATRDRIAENAFPKENVTEPRALATLILRFTPSFSPEFQITATINQGDTASVKYRAAKHSSREAFRKLSPNVVPDDVVKLMEMQDRSPDVQASLIADWFREFWVALEKTAPRFSQNALTRSIQLDGTQYMCDYEDQSVHLTLRFSSSEVGHEGPNDPALVKWMNKVRRGVQDQLARPQAR